VAEHGIKMGHLIQFHDTNILTMISGRMERPIKEAREMEIYPDNMDREKVSP
jgi:hypothetical protein